MTKRVFSFVLSLVLILSLTPVVLAAPDEAVDAADTLYNLGLFKGTGTDKNGMPVYSLDAVPTRNQAIIMLVRLLGKEEEALKGNWELPFTDVEKDAAAYPYIGYAYANGLTNGTTATTYSGKNTVRVNQYITFVLRALGYRSGEDFSVSNAWEFSDQIGLTSGEYSAATKVFNRGHVAKISCAALDVCPKGSAATLLEKLKAEGAVGPDRYKTWYEVDEDGSLWMKTNYSISTQNGHWVLAKLRFSNGSISCDCEVNRSMPVSYHFNSLLSHCDDGALITGVDYYVFEDADTYEAFWEAVPGYTDMDDVIEAFSDHLLMHFWLENDISVENSKDQFEITEFSISRHEKKGTETYTARISEEILPLGEYGLVYEGRSGGQSHGLSYIGRGVGCLTFTREIDHFAKNSAAGDFRITHVSHAMREDGSILCTVRTSKAYPYQF